MVPIVMPSHRRAPPMRRTRTVDLGARLVVARETVQSRLRTFGFVRPQALRMACSLKRTFPRASCPARLDRCTRALYVTKRISNQMVMNKETSMANNRVDVTQPSSSELALSRVFAAPTSVVFDAWTKPELLRRWYGPQGWELV